MAAATLSYNAYGIGVLVWSLIFMLSAAVLLQRLEWPRFPLLLLWLVPLFGAVAAVPVLWTALGRTGRSRWLTIASLLVVLDPLIFFWLAYSDWPDEGASSDSSTAIPAAAEPTLPQAARAAQAEEAPFPEQQALAEIRGYLRAGHTLEALRKAGWQDWIQRFEDAGTELRPEQPPPGIKTLPSEADDEGANDSDVNFG